MSGSRSPAWADVATPRVIGRDSIRSDATSTWLRALSDLELSCEHRARSNLDELCGAGPSAVVLQFPAEAGLG